MNETAAVAGLQVLADVMAAHGQAARFETRPGQRAMAEAVAQALEHGTDLLVEAGTGTGKTLAYLLPILASGRKAVLATATRHLQSQILEHDIPLALSAAGVERKVTVLKGRANYLCHHRIHRQVALVPPGLPLPMDLVQIEGALRRSQTGDRAEVLGVDEQSPIWPDVTSTADNCLGSSCPFADECFVSAARRRALAADLVVVNHHLLLADYALRERWEGAVSLLPQAGVIVIDEAHALADVATAFFGATLTDRRVDHLVRDLRTMAKGIGDEDLASDLRLGLDGIEEASAALAMRLRATRHQQVMDLKQTQELQPIAAALELALGQTQSQCSAPEVASDPAWQKAGEALYTLRGDLGRTLLDPEPGMVRWVEHRGRDVAIVARPVDVAPILKRTLLAEAAVRIFTSATLATAGRFEHARERLGLAETTPSLQVEGTFDYATQALLYVPHLPDPFANGRDEAVAHEVEMLATAAAGGTFALFSSHRAMRDAFERVSAVLPFTCLVQGAESKERLLERFVREQPAVLFATMGFWQGVDLPADVLRMVAMDKIPFPPPDDPLFAARAALLESDGRLSFQALSLPAAAIALRQGFGRLVRSKRHWGVVAILDPRLASKSYGRTLLDSLPPARRTRDFGWVRDFLLDRMT
jgi:ATP-dependent DNA helicase DinG